MSVVLVGNQPFSAKEVGSGMVAKVEHIHGNNQSTSWHEM